VLLFSSFLNACYFMPIAYRAFFSIPEESMFKKGVQEGPLFCVVPLVITTLISIFFLFYPQPFLDLATMMVQSLKGM